MGGGGGGGERERERERERAVWHSVYTGSPHPACAVRDSQPFASVKVWVVVRSPNAQAVFKKKRKEREKKKERKKEEALNETKQNHNCLVHTDVQPTSSETSARVTWS